jgi:hypothetical protein
LGRRPFFMNFSVSFGSCPSKPTMITRRIQGFARERWRKRRQAMRNGQMRRERRAMMMVVKTTRNDDRSANPAPGPM